VTGATAQKKAPRLGKVNAAQRQIFLSLYPNRHQSILKPRGCSSWTTISKHGRLTDENILKAISSPCSTLVGCRWGELSRFAVFDIDASSKYHNELGLARIKHALANVGLTKPVFYRSSLSGGWHIYLFFSDWIEAEDLQEIFRTWLKTEGFEIRQGQFELFPSSHALRLPLQSGFAWLDENANVEICREDLSVDEAIAKFLDALDVNPHDWQSVQRRIESRLEQIRLSTSPALPADKLKNKEPEEDGFSAFFSQAGMIPEVYNAGRDFWKNGLSAPNQRHHAQLSIGHYLWYGDECEGVRALPGIAKAEHRANLIEKWLREKHNGYSKTVLKGDWKEIGGDIRRACNWQAPGGSQMPKKGSYPLTDRSIDRLIDCTKKTGRIWYPDDLKKGNVGREEEAREKIRAGLVRLLESGRRVTVRGLERATGCKRETIRRHVDIWGVFRLSNGPGDLSSGGAAPSSDSSIVLDESSEGFLAAELDSLRLNCSRADGEELKARPIEEFPAVNPNQFNYGVKLGLPSPACAAPPAFFVSAAYPHSQRLAPVFLGSFFYWDTSSKSKAMTRPTFWDTG